MNNELYYDKYKKYKLLYKKSRLISENINNYGGSMSMNRDPQSLSAYDFLKKDKQLRETMKKENPEWPQYSDWQYFCHWKELAKEKRQPYIDLANNKKQSLLENPSIVETKNENVKEVQPTTINSNPSETIVTYMHKLREKSALRIKAATQAKLVAEAKLIALKSGNY
ncbi:unnamed protein product [marine sediment metagenome]|uniref:Uncharacterized protein n=1 Tax=marine sediment metagenome TaxID=412755 RepID=X0RL95_9ZZZZ